MSTLASEGTTIKLEPDRCKCGSPFTGVVLETITSGDLLEPDENGFQEIELSASTATRSTVPSNPRSGMTGSG